MIEQSINKDAGITSLVCIFSPESWRVTFILDDSAGQVLRPVPMQEVVRPSHGRVAHEFMSCCGPTVKWCFLNYTHDPLKENPKSFAELSSINVQFANKFIRFCFNDEHQQNVFMVYTFRTAADLVICIVLSWLVRFIVKVKIVFKGIILPCEMLILLLALVKQIKVKRYWCLQLSDSVFKLVDFCEFCFHQSAATDVDFHFHSTQKSVSWINF